MDSTPVASYDTIKQVLSGERQSISRRHGSMKNVVRLSWQRLRDDISNKVIIVTFQKKRTVNASTTETIEINSKKFIHTSPSVDSFLLQQIEEFLESPQFPSSDLSSLPSAFSDGRSFYWRDVNENERVVESLCLCFASAKLRMSSKTKHYRAASSEQGLGEFKEIDIELFSRRLWHMDDTADLRTATIAERRYRQRHFIDPEQPFDDRLRLILEEKRDDRSLLARSWQQLIHRADYIGRYAQYGADFVGNRLSVKRKSDLLDAFYDVVCTDFELPSLTDLPSIDGFSSIFSVDASIDMIENLNRIIYGCEQSARIVSRRALRNIRSSESIDLPLQGSIRHFLANPGNAARLHEVSEVAQAHYDETVWSEQEDFVPDTETIALIP